MEHDFVKNLPSDYVRRLISMPHFDGRKWLAELPSVIRSIEREWGLRAGPPYPSLSYNYVAPCVLADGTGAVLKIGLPEAVPEIHDEARALEHFGGRGCVRMLRFGREREALLLEKIEPGPDLKRVCAEDRERAVDTALELLSELHGVPPTAGDFADLDRWFEDVLRKTETLPERGFAEAARTILELNREAGDGRILHADFHHSNILFSGSKGFVAIDPKGMRGHIAYDIAVFLNNHALWCRAEEGLEMMLERAVGKFSRAFGVGAFELKEWARAQQVVAAFWDLEDGSDEWPAMLELASVWDGV